MKNSAVGMAALLALLANGMTLPQANAQSDFLTENMPYDAFDALDSTPIAVEGGTLHIGFAPGKLTLPRARILAWLGKSARAVSIYYGHFPVASARILVVPVRGQGIEGAQAFGYRGSAVRLMVGTDTTEDDLTEDWKAVHEMIHLALPDVRGQHLWLAEGLAVYIESIARVQAGDLTEAKIWQEFLRDMPKGMPREGDKGLDFTPTWGRRYWGGAIFCLLADIEYRKRTGNRQGLQSAMRGVLAAGGNMEQNWPFERILATADKAVGYNVLTDLYAKMRADPAPPDLDALWRDLGIIERDGEVTFDNTAVESAIRQAITQPMAAAPSSQ